jgi:acetylornithine aminotransferase
VNVTPSLEPQPTSAEVLAAFAARSWRSNAKRQIDKGVEFVIGRRDGIYLWNLEGTKRVIDCGTAGGVHSLGHRHPEVLAALTGALADGRDTGLWSMPNADYLRLQDRLTQLAPYKGLNRSVITLSSTASIDVATMFAFRFTQRRKILAYRHGYHGHSGFAVLATGSTEEGVIDYYNLPSEYSAFFDTYGDLAEIERRLTPDIGALIVEPMNYETFELAAKDYFEGLSALCKQRGVLFIVDETRTGIGRSGRLWASEHYDIEPAMMISGKGLSGGLYPVSALLTREDIYEKCMNEHAFAYISSLGGNEISCIVASKVLEVASRPAFLKNVRDTSDVLQRELAAVCRKYHNLVSLGACQGGLFTVKINDKALAPRLYKAVYDQGVLCHSVSVIEPVVLKFLPPLTLDAGGAREIAGALDRALEALKI